jgi:hypothetical protein
VWGTKDGNLEGGDCEIRGDMCKVQACNCDRKCLGRGIDQGRGEGKGCAACQLESRIDMWDFGSLQMASACERGDIRCARIDFRRGLEEPACQTWSYNEPKVLSSFHPGLWFVSGGGGAAMEEARYGRWAAGEEGGGRGIQNQRRGRSSLHCCTESWKLIGVANSKSKLCIRTSCCVDVSKSVPFPSIPPVLSHSAHPYLRAPALSPDS